MVLCEALAGKEAHLEDSASTLMLQREVCQHRERIEGQEQDASQILCGRIDVVGCTQHG